MTKQTNNARTDLGFEAQLWAAADKLRGNMEPSDYKHVTLGLIFLKYISDAFEAKRADLIAEELADPEDPEEYLAENVFWVPKEARWSHLQAGAKQTTIGKDIDDAMLAIEARNASLKGVLPKDYARPALNKRKPVGWSLARLSILAKVNTESWSKKNIPEEIEYVDLANTKWGSVEVIQRFLWQDAPIRAKRILRPGDTIVGLVRPGNGSYAYIGVPNLTGSTGFAVLRPREPKNAGLVYLTATAPENIERLAHLADGAAYPAVRPEAVEATEVVISNSICENQFSVLVAPFIDRMEKNKIESKTLVRTRDFLLPKLMTGEIRLRDAEKVVEAVA